MRQYELAIRIAQIHHLVDERKYKKALAVIQTLDIRQVRSVSDLKVFAEVYTRTERYDEAKAIYLKICRTSKTRRVLHRLVYLSIRTKALEDAEAYYQEYLRMNPSTRDALILRYRIDKAAGVPIGQLIEALQELKREEYIEEWAYELAKLYHRAGRREECMEECKDIMLWFGSGEIVERARILMDHLKERDPIPYYDDKDFTVPKKEEPNPYDTGSLPDLNEFIKERKALKRADRAARKAETGYKENDTRRTAYTKEKEEGLKRSKEQAASDTEFIDDYEEDDFELPQVAKGGIHKLSGLLKFGKKDEDKEKADRKEKEQQEQKKEESSWEAEQESREAKQKEEEQKPEEKRTRQLEEEPEQKVSEEEKRVLEPKREAQEPEMGVSVQITKVPVQEKVKPLPQKEKAITESEKQEPETEQEPVKVKKEPSKKKKVEYVPHSQSGTGITQDLAREITAIYEQEQQEQQGQLEEKTITVVGEDVKAEAKESISEKEQAETRKPIRRVRPAGEPKDKTNMATSLVDRMTQAIQKSASKSYISIDVEEIRKNNRGKAVPEKQIPPQGGQHKEERMLSKGTDKKEESVQHKEEPVLSQESDKKEEPVQYKKELIQPQEMQYEEEEAIKDVLTLESGKEEEDYQTVNIQQEQQIEEIAENEEELLKSLLEEEIEDPERLMEETGQPEITKVIKESEEEAVPSEVSEEPEKGIVLPENSEESEEKTESSEVFEEPEEVIIQPEEESEEEVAQPEESEEEVVIPEVSEEEMVQPEVLGEPEEAESSEVPEEPEEGMTQPEDSEETEKLEEEAVPLETEEAVKEPEEEKAVPPETEEAVKEPEEDIAVPSEMTEPQEEEPEETENTKDLTETIQKVKKGASALQDYHAPEIPVVETSYAAMPQITYEDLPTTRALQQSFHDMLRLIEGELDPSHFVLMGDGTERIVGVSKKIVHVMKASNYLSQGRIAKIRASQLNKMDLISFRKQLKGNCLLIEEASDLLFPTITKIFSIMEEYAGDFVVILSDEGTTLDQLFRFVPVLAKRFKYIIDITKYTKKDYE